MCPGDGYPAGMDMDGTLAPLAPKLLPWLTPGRILLAVASLVGLSLLGWLSRQGWFYGGLGISPRIGEVDATALVLFLLVMPVFTFLLQPVFAAVSRRHEFEADAFAARHARAQDLVSALVKLYKDNASTLTPDPVHSAFYDSHPPASQRIGRLGELEARLRDAGGFALVPLSVLFGIVTK